MPSLFLLFFFHFFWKAAQCVPNTLECEQFHGGSVDEEVRGNAERGPRCFPEPPPPEPARQAGWASVTKRRRYAALHVGPDPVAAASHHTSHRNKAGRVRVAGGERGLGGEDVFLVGCILTLCKHASLLSALCKSGSRYGLFLSFSLRGVGCVMKFTPTGRRFRRNSFSHLKENVLVWAAKIAKLLF